MQPLIALIYFSGTGNTARLATAIREGAGAVVEVVEHRIVGTEIVDGRFRNESVLDLVDSAAGVFFGSPTYMGGPAAEFKAFADATSARWSQGRWKDKVAAGFTTGTCSNGDQSHTLNYFTILAAQHGMLWCNLDIPGGEDPEGRNRLGSQVGVVSQAIDGKVDTGDLKTATHLGHRVATLVNRLNGNNA
jgi:NAD(P)H dehydrogenase (quinone)